MVHGLNPPLTPRRPGQLQVLCVARISTEKQDELSLEDQAGLHQHFVRENYAGDAAFEIVATCASGEHLDRQETQAIRDHIATRRFDLVVMEDLGRLLRDVDAVKLCGFCHDYETRLIAINDHVDTAQDNWQDMALFAAWRHTKYNEDTSRRIKQRLAERFIRDGKIVQCEIFGYLKPPICKDETDLKRDPAAETIYDQWFRKLEQGASYSEIADWLNVSGVKPGPYSRRNTWDCAMVARVTHNPILKGLRVRNRMITRKHHQSGHRISVKARPEDLKTRVCAHLAFIEPDRYDRVIRELDLRNSRYRRRMVDGADPLHGRPKKRTIWPGQHAICGICGRPMVYGGHGQKGHLVCRGNKEYVCWNGVSTDGLKASERIFHAVMDCITTLPDFDGQFRRQVQEMLANLTTSRATRETQLNQMHHELIRKRNNLLAALEECGPSPSLKDRLAELDRQAAELGAQRERLKALCTPTIAVPSMADLRKIAHAQLGSLDRRSPEFGRLMQGLLSSVTCPRKPSPLASRRNLFVWEWEARRRVRRRRERVAGRGGTQAAVNRPMD